MCLDSNIVLPLVVHFSYHLVRPYYYAHVYRLLKDPTLAYSRVAATAMYIYYLHLYYPQKYTVFLVSIQNVMCLSTLSILESSIRFVSYESSFYKLGSGIQAYPGEIERYRDQAKSVGIITASLGWPLLCASHLPRAAYRRVPPGVAHIVRQTHV